MGASTSSTASESSESLVKGVSALAGALRDRRAPGKGLRLLEVKLVRLFMGALTSGSTSSSSSISSEGSGILGFLAPLRADDWGRDRFAGRSS